MRVLFVFFLMLALTSLACAVTSVKTPAPLLEPTHTVSAASIVSSVTQVPVRSTLTSTATLLPVTPSSTPNPAGTILVDTLDQEVYPFTQNGKCSLAEAIFAANSEKPQDSCAAGVRDHSVIVLMPGIYRFSQADHSPQQGEWAYSTRTVGNALPAIIRSLTIRGNGATLQREGTQEQFRFLEVLFGTLTLQDLTLQGGDVGKDDWGGGIYSFNASITMDKVNLIANSAENGGGMYFNLGALTITNCQFSENEADFAGAGVYIDTAKVEIRSTQFSGNHAVGRGAGLFAESVTLRVAESLFLKNVTDGTRGGGLDVEHVNMIISHSQFYQNQAYYYGGAVSINNPVVAGTDSADGDPMDKLGSNPVLPQLQTLVPGLDATLQAHPSGAFQELVEDGQIHDSCFANNITVNPGDPNWAAAMVGKSQAEDNYWGDPSGPAGMGPGKGDQVGKRITFAPFLSEMPAYCDSTLADQN